MYDYPIAMYINSEKVTEFQTLYDENVISLQIPAVTNRDYLLFCVIGNEPFGSANNGVQVRKINASKLFVNRLS